MDSECGQGGEAHGVYKEQCSCDGKQNITLNREEARGKAEKREVVKEVGGRARGAWLREDGS